MKILRHLTSTSLIAIYLLMAVGGDTFHQLQHLVADGKCFGNSHDHASSIDGKTEDFCPHSHAEHLSDFDSENEHLSGTDFPRNHKHEESSSDCWTCFFLSQASDTSFEITLDISDDFVCFVAANYEHWYLRLKTYRFLVRGPPQFLLQQS